MRIKKVNVEKAELRSWTDQHLKENRELSNQQVVQDLALKHRNYGVNEIHPNAAARVGGASHAAPYARYVVRSLAASAKTPEPGIGPISLL